MIPGCDVSDNNGVIDWPTAAKALIAQHPAAFVVVKVNEESYVSTQMHQQRMGAHAAGIKYVFLYDFARFDLCSGRAEAERFIGDVGTDGGLLPNEGVWLDLEQLAKRPDLANADLRAYVLDWVNVVAPAQSPGVKVVLYSAVDQLKSFHMYEEPSPLHDPRIGLALCDVWNDAVPTSPIGQVLFWQHDWHGQIPGVPTEVDLDWFLGDEATMKALTWGNQPDPLAGKAVGTADVSGDVPTILKRILADAQAAGQATIAADAALALQAFGLLP